MQYDEAANLFATSKNKTAGKKIGRNTYVIQNGLNYCIRLYNTDIITFTPNGSIILRSGGYRTATTKNRINEFAHGLHITQEDGLWYVHVKDQTVLFTDNMVVPMNAPIDGDNANMAAMTAAKKAVNSMVSKYIKGYIEDMVKNGISEPSDGDCWGCIMRSADDPNDLEPMGYDHYFSHFKEKYYVPTIFYKAIQERKYGNPGLALNMMRHDPKFLKREGTTALQRFFRIRKLGLVAALQVTKRVNHDS